MVYDSIYPYIDLPYINNKLFAHFHYSPYFYKGKVFFTKFKQGNFQKSATNGSSPEISIYRLLSSRQVLPYGVSVCDLAT